MLIKGQASNERRSKRRRSQTSGTLDTTTGGTVYAVIDPSVATHEQHVEHVLDGEKVWMPNRVAYVSDPEMAADARAQGLQVVPHEKHVATGKAFFTVPELPWKKDKETNSG